MEEIGLDKEDLRKRTKVLKTALLLEGLTSSFISGLLDIDVKNSKAFGNKSSALSFSGKIHLLTDMRSLQKEESTKFEKFMSIRNQFMHNLSANTFENCVVNIDGLGIWLLKQYPQDEKLKLELEIKYEKSIDALCHDLISITAKLIEQIEAKIKKEVKSKVNEQIIVALFANLKDETEQLDQDIESIIETGEITNIKKLRGRGEILRQSVLQKSINHAEEENGDNENQE
jgi:hypothetical protein